MMNMFRISKWGGLAAASLLAAVLTAPLIARAEPLPPIRVVAPTFNPLQMMVDGEARGYVVDLVKELLKRLAGGATPPKIEIVPWTRAKHLAETQPNVLFFSISRTPKREDRFNWVGEVSPYDIYFFKINRRADVQAETLEDLREAPWRVGVQAGSNTEGLLKDLGFRRGKDYVTYSHYSFGVRMLFKDRFAVMPLTKFVARANVCKLGFPGHEIEPVVRVDALSNPLWMVFSKGTAPDLVDRFRGELVALKKAGVDKRLRELYLQDLWSQPCEKAPG